MDGAPPVLELPSDKVRPSVKGYGGAAYLFELGQELCEGLRALSQQIGVTMFMTLLAGFKTLLHRYTGQADIVVGTPISGRTRTEIEGLIGFFVNTLVLRTNLGSNPRFVDLLKQERDVVLDAYAHQEAPFERLVEELQPGRDLSRTPLFQVMFAFQNTPRQTVKMEGLSWEPVPIEHESAKFDLMLFVTDTGSKLKLSLQYSTDLFEEEAIRRMAGNLQLILKGIVSNPEQHIKELPLVTEAERRQLLTEWNDTQRSYDDSLLIHQLFESQVERRPEAVALVCGEDSLSYAELNRRANLLAHHLRRLGIGSETLVGVLMDRSTEMLVSLLAVLKSGGAYVPLDPQYPAERLAFMLEDTAVRVLLTQRRMVESLPEHQAKIVCVDTDWGEIADGDELNSDSLAQPDNLAYVIYTSGSTGKPKGVAITHRSCSIFLQWAAETFSAEDFKGALASTSICFDLSIFELFAPLCCGGSIVMAQNVLQLAQLGDGHPVRLINTVPSAMTELLRLEQVPESVQIVNLAGEALSRQLVEQIYSHPNVRQVWNLYGPSEDTTYSTAALVLRGGGRVTIGRPVSQTQAYVLDELLQCVPVGVAGELYLGGDGLARGYLNRSNSTAERFVPDPYSPEPGRRLYRTGDLARYLADGQLEHLGRVDYQVKIRGFRIELGEIESTLHNHPDVHEATVIAREIQVGEKQLVAYVAPKEGTELRVKQLRAYLQEKLPDYMIPNAFVFLKKMPLTPNGKIDRQALPTSGLNFGQEDDYVAPRGTAEKLLCDIWADVLCIDRVGINDNFFAIGGHSLRAIQVISRVRDAFEVDLPLRSVFEAATVSGLAVKIAQAIISQSD
jgi:amino acid adenylation domain-containing protein